MDLSDGLYAAVFFGFITEGDCFRKNPETKRRRFRIKAVCKLHASYAPRFAWYGAPAARYECFAWIGCALFQRARNATVTQGNGIFLMGGFGSGFWPQGNPPLQSVKGVFVKTR